MLYYIIYQSIPSDQVSPELIDSITQESINWNSKHNITGILIYHDNRYLQYLEGDEKDVVEVFKMIKKDPRHHSIEPKVMGYTDNRVFSDWSMGSWMVGSDGPGELQILKDLGEYISNPINSELESRKYISMMHNIMLKWIEQDEERAKQLKTDRFKE